MRRFMENIIIVTVLILILAAAIYGTVKRIRFGSSCCGTKTPPEKKVKVKDRNKNNYPYRYILSVDGMHCSNCARRVENALNKTEGRWATVDLADKEVSLYSKHEETDRDLAGVIAASGYTMLSFKKC
jgi:copper chaperone CopZ